MGHAFPREVSSGEIHIAGERCDHLLPSSRGMAMVFQCYALYPHRSVYENLRFARLKSGERITGSFRGILDLADDSATGYAAEAEYVHLFDEDGLALPALQNWHGDYGVA